MSLLPNDNNRDIRDDEIRIISSDRKDRNESLPASVKTRSDDKNVPSIKNSSPGPYGPKPLWKLWVIITAILFFGGICVFFWWEVKDDP